MAEWCKWCGVAPYMSNDRCGRCNQHRGHEITWYTRHPFWVIHEGRHDPSWHSGAGCGAPLLHVTGARNPLAWCAARTAFWDEDSGGGEDRVAGSGRARWYHAGDNTQQRVSECMHAWSRREERRHRQHAILTSVHRRLTELRRETGHSHLIGAASTLEVTAMQAAREWTVPAASARVLIEDGALVIELLDRNGVRLHEF